jgi:hypothetical protein
MIFAPRHPFLRAFAFSREYYCFFSTHCDGPAKRRNGNRYCNGTLLRDGGIDGIEPGVAA